MAPWAPKRAPVADASATRSRGEKPNSNHKGRNATSRKYSEDDDNYSGTTASPSCGSWPNSDDDDRFARMLNTPPPPPVDAPRTKLSSGKTKLTSGAALFVPQAALVPQAPILPGKDFMTSVIQHTLGSELWNLSMADCQSFTGDWYSAVEITIPALTASQCHVAVSNDADKIAAAQQAAESQARQSLVKALKGLSPQVTVAPVEDGAPISAEFCPLDRDKLCWEFSHFGTCPRGSTCRWQHAMVETFLIQFFVQPLTQWCGTESVQNTHVVQSMPTQATVPHTVASKSGKSRNSASLPATPVNKAPIHSEAPRSRLPSEKVLGTPTAVRTSIPGRKMWADIEDDDC